MTWAEPHITPDSSEEWNGVWTVSGYPQAASDALAKMFTEAHRFMHFLYTYLLTTDHTLLSFLVQKQQFRKKKQNMCFKTQTQQFAPCKETPTTIILISPPREALSSLLQDSLQQVSVLGLSFLPVLFLIFSNLNTFQEKVNLHL